jgi:cytolysin-activating lysine-acyltransferase
VTALDSAEGPGGALAGIAFWATVSEAVDAKIREQIKGGAFPIRLKPEDWNSGEHVWLFDVIAPSQKMASSVLANFKQVVKQGGDVRIHPMVARQVDPELLKKMGAAVDGGVAQ